MSQPDPSSDPTPAAPLPLSAEQRASLTSRRATLAAALATFTPAAQPLVDALAADFQQSAGMEEGMEFRAMQEQTRLRTITMRRVDDLKTTLAPQRTTFQAALEGAFSAARDVVREPLMAYVMDTAMTALQPLYANEGTRRRLVRQSDLYGQVRKGLKGGDYFDAMPVDQLLPQAAGWLALIDRLLAGTTLADLGFPGITSAGA